MGEKLDLFEASAIDKQKRHVMEKASEDGCACPVCGQFVKVYKRRITSAMARQLIISWRDHGHEWFHISSFRKPVTDWAILHHFGLIEPKEHDPGAEGKKTSGYWRITTEGYQYLRDLLNVPEYALVYNGRFLGYDGTVVGIREALGTRFDYKELMEA